MTLLAPQDTVMVVSRCWSCGEPQTREIQERHVTENRFWNCSRCEVRWGEKGEPVRG